MAVYAYIVLKKHDDPNSNKMDQETLIKELKQLVKTKIAGFAVPGM